MISIGIADDHPMVRRGLRDLLLDREDFTVAWEARDGSEAVELLRHTKVDVLIMDVNMPGRSGVDALAKIRVCAPKVAVLIYSAYPQEQYAALLVQFGARGFLNKDGDPMEVIWASRELALGRHYLTPAVAELFVDHLAGKPRAPHNFLSERELQVFLRLANGKRPCTIASELSLSIKTVSTYRARVMTKLCLSSTSDLTYYALKHQLLN
jgi:DNA-binding NarL/FixJ family response regulator